MAQGYYIHNAGSENLQKYAIYVEECIAKKEIPLTYSGYMKKRVSELLKK